MFQPYKEFKPLNFSKKFKLCFVLPARLFAYFTIVDFRRFEDKKDLFLIVTLITSLLMIGLCSYSLVWILVTLCDTFNMSETIMGFTFFAAVSSVQETVTSIALCKRELRRIQSKKNDINRLNMALSKCIGSNIFDLTIGIGLPYFLNSVIVNQQRKYYTPVYNKNLALFISGLLICLILFIFALIVFRWRFTKYLGFFTLTIWLVYTSLAISIELKFVEFNFFKLWKLDC